MMEEIIHQLMRTFRHHSTVSEESKTLHNYIVNGDIENVRTFLSSKTHHLLPYLNEKGKSAAYVAIKHRQFHIYSLLLSHDIRFISDYERKIFKKLTPGEITEFDKAIARNLNEFKDATVDFLLSNTKFINSTNNEKILDIRKYYEELNDIPEIGLLFSVIHCNEFVKIIFDFEINSASAKSTLSSISKEIVQQDDGIIFIRTRTDDENIIKSRIAHQLTHYAMQIVFSNKCKPYFDNSAKQQEFNDMTFDIKKLIDIYPSSPSSGHFDQILRLVFQHDQLQWPAELIVRVNQMLAFYGKEKGEQLLNEQAGELLRYYRENVMIDCKQFIRESYLLKPKSEIALFNLSTDLLTTAKESAVTFKLSFRSELDTFISSKHSFLLLSTPSSILSSIKMLQSMKELHLDLNRFILIGLRNYSEQFHVVCNLLASDSCNLVIFSDFSLGAENFDPVFIQLLNNLTSLLQSKPKFKIILVFHKNKLASVVNPMTEFKCKYRLIMEDNNFGLNDLTFQTQRYISLKQIEIQGQQTFLKTITKTNSHLIDANIVAKLISDEKLKIGSTFIPEDFNPDTYISRELSPTKTDTSDNEYELALPKTGGPKIRSISRNEQISETFTETGLIDFVANEKVVVISGNAGSGKSTLLTQIAILIKRQSNDVWIAKINLNRFTKLFRSKKRANNKFRSSEAVEFLIKSQQLHKNDTENADLSLEIFQTNLEKVVAMFDGFDEINPDYAETVHSLIKATIEANVKQIWLTTRPQCKTTLESQFQCKPFEIDPLNDKSQLGYLVQYWKTHLKVEDKDDDLNRFAKHLQSVIKETVMGRSSFLENPLQLMMLAEELLNQCNEFLQSSTPILNIPKFNENLVKIGDLYDKFIVKKFHVYQHEKLRLDFSKIGARHLLPKKIFEIHQIQALKLYFKPNEVETLLTNVGMNEDEVTYDSVEAFGLITKLENNQPEFVHLTFAEYFVATFIAIKLLPIIITKDSAKLLLENVFVSENFKVIRSFLNNILTTRIIKKLKNPENFVDVWQQYFFIGKDTPISVALLEGKDKLIQFLCTCMKGTQLCSELLANHPQTGDTLLHLAAKNNNTALISLLTDDYKVDVDSTNESGNTPLHLACTYSSKQTIQFYIQNYGANVNAVDKNGTTPLHWAAGYNRPEVVKMLIDYEADIQAVDKHKSTLLHWAAKNNTKEVIQMLIGNGANVNAVDNDGNTSLHWAAHTNSKEVIKVLVDNGASINAVNDNRITPLDMAFANNNKDGIKILVEDYKAVHSNNCNAVFASI